MITVHRALPPTAQTFRTVIAATPEMLVLPRGLGAGTCFQPDPVSRSDSGAVPKRPVPTAHAPLAELAETLSSRA